MISGIELNEYSKIIDDCRTLVSKIIIREEISFSYCIFQLYCKSLLTMCEIYTLLLNGYPEGAMALSRNLYEALVIMSYLYDHKSDQELIERFVCDYDVRTCQDEIRYLNWCIDNSIANDDTLNKLDQRMMEFNELCEKYKNFCTTKSKGPFFSQYWWAGERMSFSKLREAAGFSDDTFYNISCYRVHAGIAGSLIKFDDYDDRVLIGACENGREIPMIFSLMSFQTMTYLFFGINNIACTDILESIDQLMKKARNSRLEYEFSD